MAQPTLVRNPVELLSRHDEASIGSASVLPRQAFAKRVYEINPLQDPRWDRLVERHHLASVFHSANWLRALRSTYGYDAVAVSTNPPDAELSNAVLFCRVESWLTGRRYVSLPFSDHCDPLVDSAGELDQLLLHMNRKVNEAGWAYVEIRPTVFDPCDATGLGKSDTYYHHRLDLHKSAEELFHDFHKDCVQRKIRRAEREKLRYEEGRSEAQLEEFYRLMVTTRRRQGLPPQPMDWFRGLIASFGDSLKIRVAMKDDTPVAGILTLSHKNCMTYKYGCSDAKFNNLGGTPLLFWKAIEDAKANGLEELDLGRSDIDNLGLVAFKEHWGASRSLVNYWRYPKTNPTNPTAWTMRLGHKIASVLPQWSLKAIGGVVYPHIG
jgi:CelD/BcsL family acetyltransferase involved in cellulose biosynthesis